MARPITVADVRRRVSMRNWSISGSTDLHLDEVTLKVAKPLRLMKMQIQNLTHDEHGMFGYQLLDMLKHEAIPLLPEQTGLVFAVEFDRDPYPDEDIRILTTGKNGMYFYRLTLADGRPTYSWEQTSNLTVFPSHCKIVVEWPSWA